jgi:putative DNA primase/helicase
MTFLDDLDQDAPQSELAFDLVERAKLPHNDVGNGARIVAAHGRDVRYVPGRGWIVWNGRVWDAERGELAAFRLAGGLQGLIEAEAASLSSRPVPQAAIDALVADKGLDPAAAEERIRAERKSGVMKFAKGCGNTGRMDAALKVARGFVPADVGDFDTFPWRITTPTGELDLLALAAIAPEGDLDGDAEREAREAAAAAALRPFDQASMATRMTVARYTPGADCPVWRDFMAKALPSPEMRSYAQRLAGYLLSGVNDAQICIVLLGGGGNGKSTFVNAISRVLGGYAVTCPIEMFLEQKGVNAAAASPQEAMLPGARAYLGSEPENNQTLSTSKVKGLTGGEPRQSRALRQDPFIWVPNGVPVLSFNRLPRITDESEGMWRRLAFLPWNVSLVTLPAEDRRSPAEMAEAVEAELPGILNWLIEGWVDFRTYGLRPPAEVSELKQARRALSDPVGEFLADHTVAEGGTRMQAKILWQIYELWCDGAAATPLSMPRFKKMLIDKGFAQVKSNGLNMWIGLAWSPSVDTDALRDRHEKQELDDAQSGRAGRGSSGRGRED